MERGERVMDMQFRSPRLAALFATPAPQPTARQIIEARLGRKLPPVSEMAPDERQAVKMLAQELIRAKGRK